MYVKHGGIDFRPPSLTRVIRVRRNKWSDDNDDDDDDEDDDDDDRDDDDDDDDDRHCFARR